MLTAPSPSPDSRRFRKEVVEGYRLSVRSEELDVDLSLEAADTADTDSAAAADDEEESLSAAVVDITVAPTTRSQRRRRHSARYVAKFVPLPTDTAYGDFDNELSLCRRAQSIGITPVEFDAWEDVVDGLTDSGEMRVGVIVLERWDGTLRQLLEDTLANAADPDRFERARRYGVAAAEMASRLRDLHITHMDLHTRNIVFRRRRRVDGDDDDDDAAVGGLGGSNSPGRGAESVDSADVEFSLIDFGLAVEYDPESLSARARSHPDRLRMVHRFEPFYDVAELVVNLNILIYPARIEPADVGIPQAEWDWLITIYSYAHQWYFLLTETDDSPIDEEVNPTLLSVPLPAPVRMLPVPPLQLPRGLDNPPGALAFFTNRSEWRVSADGYWYVRVFRGTPEDSRDLEVYRRALPVAPTLKSCRPVDCSRVMRTPLHLLYLEPWAFSLRELIELSRRLDNDRSRADWFIELARDSVRALGAHDLQHCNLNGESVVFLVSLDCPEKFVVRFIDFGLSTDGGGSRSDLRMLASYISST